MKWMLAVLARNGQCPDAVVRLILALDQVNTKGASSSVRSEESPLDIWAALKTHAWSSEPDPMLPVLLEAYPSSNDKALSLAVACGKFWRQVEPLWLQGRPEDDFTLFVLAALAPVICSNSLFQKKEEIQKC
jgi:hypothetical protein